VTIEHLELLVWTREELAKITDAIYAVRNRLELEGTAVRALRSPKHDTTCPAPSPASGESAEELSDAEAKRLYEEAEPVPFGAHEVERFVRTTVDPQSEVLALQKQRNDVYEERDRLVCALSKVFPSWLARHPETDKAWDDDWRWIVFVQLPTGQATWHIQDRELPWFAHLERRTENVWDGHTTEEKYRRLAALKSVDRATRIVDRSELFALRAEVELLRGAASVDVEAVVRAVVAEIPNAWYSTYTERIVNALRTALGAQAGKEEAS